MLPSVAYTDPEVARVGLTEDRAKAEGIKVSRGRFPWTASGRAIANGRDEGVKKIACAASVQPETCGQRGTVQLKMQNDPSPYQVGIGRFSFCSMAGLARVSFWPGSAGFIRHFCRRVDRPDLQAPAATP